MGGEDSPDGATRVTLSSASGKEGIGVDSYCVISLYLTIETPLYSAAEERVPQRSDGRVSILRLAVTPANILEVYAN
jgi:hypothetical protein